MKDTDYPHLPVTASIRQTYKVTSGPEAKPVRKKEALIMTFVHSYRGRPIGLLSSAHRPTNYYTPVGGRIRISILLLTKLIVPTANILCAHLPQEADTSNTKTLSD